MPTTEHTDADYEFGPAGRIHNEGATPIALATLLFIAAVVAGVIYLAAVML